MNVFEKSCSSKVQSTEFSQNDLLSSSVAPCHQLVLTLTFLQSVQESSSVSGLNLAQIVTKWILLIMMRDTGTMERSETALNKYLTRHVRDKSNYRAKCMIRMLVTVHKSNYNVSVINKRSSISYNRLKRTKPDGTFQAMELEIISYEQLWQMLLDFLAAGKKMYA